MMAKKSKKSLLETSLKKASQDYYNNGSSSMSDEEFDAKLEELRKIDPNSEIVTSVGHGYDINEDTTFGEKVDHRYGLVGSLSKSHNWNEFSNDLKNQVNIYSLKLDGISVVLYYKNSKLEKALTRGDGTTGIDITNKVDIILNHQTDIDPSIPPFTGAVRGELIMLGDDFDQFKHENPEAKNPRNSTAGLINMKDLSKDLKYVSLIAYSIVGCSEKIFTSYPQILGWLDDAGFSVVPYDGYASTEEFFMDQMNEVRERWYNGTYPADGIVIANNEITYNKIDEEIGYEISYNSQAFKFPAERKWTKVTNVIWNLGKTKNIIPKIEVETVELSGTNVSYTSGFNARYIKDNNIKPGVEVLITKSGEIIPTILEIRNNSNSGAQLPETCPSCNSDLEWNGVHLGCPNPECENALMQDLIIWLKTISPVDGMSDDLIEQYLEDMKVRSIESFYLDDLSFEADTSKKRDILFQDMISRCNKKDNSLPLSVAVQACNIPRFGDVTSEKISRYPNEVRNIINNEKVDEYISTIEPIGKANIDSLIENIDKLRNLKFIEDMIDWNVKQSTQIETKGDVCITGKLSMKRSEFESILKDHGYNPTGSVTKKTLFLITDNPESSSSKNKKANQLGVEKISEKEFTMKYLQSKGV